MNFWSHSSISVVFLRASDSSSGVVTGSLRWCSHHSTTFRRTASLTCRVPVSCILKIAPKIRWKVAYVGDGNRVVLGDVGMAQILQHVLQKHGTFNHDTVWVQQSVSSRRQRESDGTSRASLPTSMVALSLEISQIFWDAGFASAIVIVGCFEKR